MLVTEKKSLLRLFVKVRALHSSTEICVLETPGLTADPLFVQFLELKSLFEQDSIEFIASLNAAEQEEVKETLKRHMNVCNTLTTVALTYEI